MSFQTVSGLASANVGASGLHEFASGELLEASDLVGDLKDLQVQPYYAMLAGVLEGGICTASGLVVTIPADTIYYARQCWMTDGNPQTVNVTDNATSYVWGCADGQVRLTNSTTPPLGWDNRTACILTKATAVSGTAMVDNSAQHRTRYANASSRITSDNGGLWAAQPDTIPTGARVEIPANHQLQIFDSLKIQGAVYILGRLRVSP